jgi:GWxTD domain-containing protein
MSGPMLQRLLAFALSTFLAATLPELFQRAKDQFKLGSYADSLKTLDALETESAKPGHDKERTALQPGLLFYRGANLAALGRADEAQEAFEGFLEYQPEARLDPAIYPKAVIAALERARESSKRKAPSPSESPAIAEAYKAFPRPQPGGAETPGDAWSEGPVRFLLTADEKRDYVRLLGPREQSEFVANFWRSRDPHPEASENAFREEFEKRVAFADAQFTQGETRGSLSDRGMVFIVLGPPTYSGRRALTTGDDAADSQALSRYSSAEQSVAGSTGGSNAGRLARVEQTSGPGTKILEPAANSVEIWHYVHESLPSGIPYQEVLFQFITKQGYGKNVLQRDPTALTTLEKSRQIARRNA